MKIYLLCTLKILLVLTLYKLYLSDEDHSKMPEELLHRKLKQL
jgi:hypothetical protein